MSIIKPNETAKDWRAHRRQTAVQLYLSGAEGDAAALVGTRVAGFPLSLNLVAPADFINPEDLSAAAAALIQVDSGDPASVKRFQKLAAATRTPVIAAAWN